MSDAPRPRLAAAAARLGALLLRRPVAGAAAVALLAFGLLSAGFRLPFLADDYLHLGSALTSPPWDLTPMGAYVSRVPVWAWLTRWLFAAPGGPWPWMYAAFLVHALAVGALGRFVLAELSVAPRTRREEAAFVAAAAVCALWPTFHELLLWPTCFAYVPGAGFLALGVGARRGLTRVLWLTLACLTSEMFLLPALVLLCGVPVLAAASARSTGPLGGRRWWGRLGSWAAAVGLTALARLALVPAFGAFAYELDFSPAHLFTQLGDGLALLFTLHFQGVRWATTALLWALVLFLAVWSWRRARVSALTLPLLVLGATLASANYWVFGHGAARALYGPGLLVCASLLFFLYRFGAAARPRATAALLGVLALLFLGHTASVLVNKDHNAGVLAVRADALAEELRRCEAPCTLTLRELDRGLAKDWALPRGYWRYFAEWVRLRRAPERTARFVVEGGE